MRDNVLRCNVFERTDDDSSRNGAGRRKYVELDTENRLFLRQMKELARGDNADLRFQVHRWPQVRPAHFDEEAEHSHYEFLDTDPYEADFSVCFAEHPYHLGPEVGHLIHARSNWIHHLLIVTHVPVAECVRRGLSAISPSSHKLKDATIFEPSCSDAELGGHMSFFDIPTMHSDDTRDRIRSIFID
jgi:hypothetical protein